MRVGRIKTLWAAWRAQVYRHRAHLALAVRVTIAAVLALGLAQFLHMALPLWAVLTAVIVTQLSVGRALKATTDYLIGTLGGAVYGGALGVLIPHSSEFALLAVLALAIGPLALIAAINPRLSVAPITAIIVLLVPTMTHASPLASAIDRVLEVTLGGVTGFVVSFLLLPSNAHRLIIEAAARTLDHMADALGALLAGLSGGLDIERLHRIQDGIGQALVHINVLGGEAENERSARLSQGPDPGPLLRTLLRLRHDLVMIGRAASSPLPDPVGLRLQTTLAPVGAAFAAYLRAGGSALLAGRSLPPLDAVDSALEAYAAEIAALRREGLTRTLSGDAAERFFALGFALEQMRRNFKDLARCVVEWADRPKKRDADQTSRTAPPPSG